MKKPRACTLILTAFWACAAAMAADEAKVGQFKPGWKDADFKAFVDACADAIVKPTVQAYQDQVKARGLTDAKPFPEKDLRDSAVPMCECISYRMAEKWSLQDLADGAEEKSKPFVEDALAGGQCKPGGFLGELVQRARESKPD